MGLFRALQRHTAGSPVLCSCVFFPVVHGPSGHKFSVLRAPEQSGWPRLLEEQCRDHELGTPRRVPWCSQWGWVESSLTDSLNLSHGFEQWEKQEAHGWVQQKKKMISLSSLFHDLVWLGL